MAIGEIHESRGDFEKAKPYYKNMEIKQASGRNRVAARAAYESIVYFE